MSKTETSEKIKVTAEEEQERLEQEQIILQEKAEDEYVKLPKNDKRFIGIDLDKKVYWIMGNSFKIKSAGFTLKKQISTYFDAHDDHVKNMSEFDTPEDQPKRLAAMQGMDQAKDEIIEKCIPLLLDDGKGFNEKKWFGDDIPAAVWWDVVRDLYLFLRGNGSRDDMVRSMMR